MSETWTEYAVRWDESEEEYEPCDSLEHARATHRLYSMRTTIVGRTVTASDWLPVDGEGR